MEIAPFLLIAMPVLAIGGIGGTLYHGFRISQLFLLMDWMPIMFICVSAAIFFFNRASGKNWIGWLALAVTLLTQFLIFRKASPKYGIILCYGLLGAMVLTPMVVDIEFATIQGN